MWGSFSRIAAGAMLLAASSQVLAFDKLSFEVGSGNHTTLTRLGAQWNWDRSWFKGESWHLGGYWQGSIANWRGTRFGPSGQGKEDIFDIGLTPVLRLQRNDLRGWYGELGIGIHWLSDDYHNNGKELSTHFQFGDHIGVGYVFHGGAELGLSYQHFSNGGFKKPNDGVNFTVVKLAYPF